MTKEELIDFLKDDIAYLGKSSNNPIRAVLEVFITHYLKKLELLDDYERGYAAGLQIGFGYGVNGNFDDYIQDTTALRGRK